MPTNVERAIPDPLRPTHFTLILRCGHDRIVKRQFEPRRWNSVRCGICELAAIDAAGEEERAK